jgi:hypothetical protein
MFATANITSLIRVIASKNDAKQRYSTLNYDTKRGRRSATNRPSGFVSSLSQKGAISRRVARPTTVDVVRVTSNELFGANCCRDIFRIELDRLLSNPMSPSSRKGLFVLLGSGGVRSGKHWLHSGQPSLESSLISSWSDEVTSSPEMTAQRKSSFS